jgi:hypothetical protein
LFERALSGKVTLRQGEQEKIITKAAAGIEQLVSQFAKGDRHARRDLLDLAARLGVDLVPGQGDALAHSVASALSANDEALLADYVRRHAGQADRAGEIDAPSRARSNRSRNCELRSQGLSCAQSQRQFSDELAYMRNRVLP